MKLLLLMLLAEDAALAQQAEPIVSPGLRTPTHIPLTEGVRSEVDILSRQISLLPFSNRFLAPHQQPGVFPPGCVGPPPTWRIACFFLPGEVTVGPCINVAAI